MLSVYTYRIPKPDPCFDFSGLSINDMVEAVISMCQHQSTGHIWFGYLEGWMLSPTDDIRLRKALRQFDCSLVCQFPLALSHAWKNELDTIYTRDPNGYPDTNNNGSTLHDGGQAQHGHPSPGVAADGKHHKDRKARSPKEGRVKARPNQA